MNTENSSTINTINTGKSARVAKLKAIFESNWHVNLYSDLFVSRIIYMWTHNKPISHTIFQCTGIKDNTWYKFQDHLWRRTDELTFRNEILTTFVDDLKELALDYLKTSVSDSDLASSTIKNATRITNILLMLQETDYMIQVLKNCTVMFFDANLEDKLNTNPHLLGFENGIFDFTTMCFRDGSPSDYVSFSVGYKYEAFPARDIQFDEIDNYFKTLHPDDETRKYLLTKISSYLVGKTDESLTTWVGCGGNNGKTKAVELLGYILGDYFGTITGSDQLCDKQGKRLLVINEGEESGDLNTIGFLKQLTGSDTIFKHPDDKTGYRPQFKILTITNMVPEIKNADPGYLRRLRIIPWESTFLDNPKGANCYKTNTGLNAEFLNWRSRLIYMLIWDYFSIEHMQKPSQKMVEYMSKYEQNETINDNNDHRAKISNSIAKLRTDLDNLQNMISLL